MPTPIPDPVKATLTELTSPQQVVLRGYIATLREEIKSLEEKIATINDPDPHAHYHGHDKCTEDHGDENHGVEEKETDAPCCDGNHDHTGHKHEHKAHDHENEHTEHKEHDHHGHDHKEHKEHDHHENEHTEHKEHDHHGHDHKEHKEHDHHEHTEHKEHDHHGNECKHHQMNEHDQSEEVDMPAWKKAAINCDPMAAPFGGDWNTEASLNAAESVQMEE